LFVLDKTLHVMSSVYNILVRKLKL